MIIFYAILGLYVVKIFNYYSGWKNIPSNINTKFKPNISVVIALRNEESNVKSLLLKLKQQDYPFNKTQLILVNDHSTDSTYVKLLENKLDNMILIDLKSCNYGKKNAISTGIKSSSGDIIITTDADCTFGSSWIKTMVSYFENQNTNLVAGPVNLNVRSGIFNNFQKLEFLSLIASGAGAIGNGHAIFCNAANMAYRKNMFYKVNSFKNDKTVSGDDVFLLHKFKKLNPRGIVFAKSTKALVETEGSRNLNEFINQRKRWTSKSISYKDFDAIYTSILVLSVNIIGIILIILSIFDFNFFIYVAIHFLIKFFIDYLLLVPVITFMNSRNLIKWIFPFQIFYSFYVVIIVALSFVYNFEWKERTHNQ